MDLYVYASADGSQARLVAVLGCDAQLSGSNCLQLAHARAPGRAIPVRENLQALPHRCESALSHRSAIVYALGSALA